jgi:hypothetical protein
MTVLRQFGGAGRHFMQDAASSYNRAFQPVYEHRRRMCAYTLTILFLPGSVGQLFGGDRGATRDNLMHKAATKGLAMCSELAFLSGKSSTRGLVALAVSPTRIRAHEPKSLHGFTQQGIVQTARRFKTCSQLFGLLAAHMQRQFQQEGGRLTFFAHTFLFFSGMGQAETQPSSRATNTEGLLPPRTSDRDTCRLC